MASLRILALILMLWNAGLCGCISLVSNQDVVSLDDSESRDRAMKEHERGIDSLQKGQLGKAQAAFEAAILIDERFGPAHNNLGLVFFEKRDLYRAAWSFQRAIQYMRNRAEPLNNLGLTLEAGGRLNEAAEQYSAAVAIEPNNPEYLGNLIRARLKNGEHVEFLRMELEWLQFIERRPDWLEWAQDQLILGSRRGVDTADGEADAPELIPTPAGERPRSGERRLPPGPLPDAPNPGPLPPPIQPHLQAPANENPPLGGIPSPVLTRPDG